MPAVVFSSTAAVYGEPGTGLLDERLPTAPINPYGASKAMSERVLADIAAATGMRYAILRYFNVAGADADGADRRGHSRQCPPDQARLRDRRSACARRMAIHGTDYPTPDGTCIRDYVHVDDLARAHLLALEHLHRRRRFAGGQLRLRPRLLGARGAGHRSSDHRRASSRSTAGPRRPGDPAVLVADSRRLRSLLGWAPRHDDLDYIVATAWRWEQALQGSPGDCRLNGMEPGGRGRLFVVVLLAALLCAPAIAQPVGPRALPRRRQRPAMPT